MPPVLSAFANDCCTLTCRVLLEETATAYEEALPNLEASASLIGVYVGCMFREYIDIMTDLGDKLSTHALIGNGDAFMVGRLSYTFGFGGPCISTDTACSSSLVAAHLAHTGLLNKDNIGAVAAGVNLMLKAGTTAWICQLQVRMHY